MAASPLEKEAALAECADPTSQVIEAWVLESAPRAVAYANSLLRDVAAAEDVVHDCYYRLLRKASRYDLPNDGNRLLFRAVTNACINYRQRRERQIGSGLGSFDMQPEISDPKATNPVDRLIVNELEQSMAEGLSLLPVNQRAALELKSLGHSLRDIAETLCTTTNHAAVLVHRARQTIATHLAPFLEESP